MIRKALIGMAAAAAVFGGSAALQPSEAQAGVRVHIGVGPYWGYSHRHRHVNRCYITHKRVWVRSWRHHRRGYWAWKPVRVCRW